MNNNKKCINFCQKQRSSTTSGLLACVCISTTANTTGCQADRKNRKYDHGGIGGMTMIQRNERFSLLTSCLQSPSRVSLRHVIRVTNEGGWDECVFFRIWADSSAFTIRLFLTVCRITTVADTASYNVTVRILAFDTDHTNNIFVFLLSCCRHVSR